MADDNMGQTQLGRVQKLIEAIKKLRMSQGIMPDFIVVNVNDTMRSIRATIEYLEVWRDGNVHCDQRHTAMVISKLEEAELLAQRIVLAGPPPEQ